MALFLRYCPACNSAIPSVSPKGECTECGAALKIVDAYALIPELGATISEPRRREALDACTGHDRPSA